MEEIEQLYSDVSTALMGKEHSPRWVAGVYPAKETLLSSIKNKTLFVLTKDHHIVGCVTLNEIPTANYNEITWKVKATESEVLYIHGFAIHPSYNGQGLGSQLLHEVKKHAERNGRQSIRLDVFHKNIPAENLYHKNGFLYVNTVNIGDVVIAELGLHDVDIFRLYEYVLG